MPEEDSRWAKWARNGRLATLVWGITFIAWLTLKIEKVPLEALDTVFVIMSGAWVTNLGMSTVRPSSSKQDQRDADKTGETNG